MGIDKTSFSKDAKFLMYEKIRHKFVLSKELPIILYGKETFSNMDLNYFKDMDDEENTDYIEKISFVTQIIKVFTKLFSKDKEN